MFSTYIEDDRDLDSIFNDIYIIKNDDGDAYWPIFGLNMINTINYKEGYQVKSNITDTVVFNGIPHLHESLVIPAGWSLLTVLDTVNVNVFNLFGAEMKIIKDEYGLFTWPYYGVHYCDVLRPGEAYWVYLEYSVTIYY